MKANVGVFVRHVFTGRVGEVFLPENGWIGINSTFVRFADGSIEEFPDGELDFAEERVARSRPG